jgi:hypothetical protein
VLEKKIKADSQVKLIDEQFIASTIHHPTVGRQKEHRLSQVQPNAIQEAVSKSIYLW